MKANGNGKGENSNAMVSIGVTPRSATLLLAAKFRTLLRRGPMRSTLLIGPPGLGKTSIAYAVASEVLGEGYGADPETGSVGVLDLTGMEPTDITGLPRVVDGVGGLPRTEYGIMARTERFCTPGFRGILVLDDVTQASPDVQVATRRLVLNRQMGDRRLSDGVLLVITGNRHSDGARARQLPSHFLNAVEVLEFQPSFQEWMAWTRARGGAFHPSVLSFLSFRAGGEGRGQVFSHLPSWATDPNGVFPTPRQWTGLGEELAENEDLYRENPAILAAICRGYVGADIAGELMAYMAMGKSLPDPKKVWEDPKGALPDPKSALNSADKVFAMAEALGRVTAEMVTEKPSEGSTIIAKGLVALQWFTDSREEFAHPFLAALKHAAKGNKTRILRFLVSAMNGDTIPDDYKTALMLYAM